MSKSNHFVWAAAASFGLCAVNLASAQPPAAVPGKNVAEMQFVPFPGMPTCASGSVQNGDPGKGPSFIMAKMAAGCSFPWHWHTPNEYLMIVSGTATAEMKDGKPVKLEAGGFAIMPSRHVHRFSCSTACSLYVYSDTAFDLHYVDGSGKEITFDVALKAVGETAATVPVTAK